MADILCVPKTIDTATELLVIFETLSLSSQPLFRDENSAVNTQHDIKKRTVYSIGWQSPKFKPFSTGSLQA